MKAMAPLKATKVYKYLRKMLKQHIVLNQFGRSKFT